MIYGVARDDEGQFMLRGIRARGRRGASKRLTRASIDAAAVKHEIDLSEENTDAWEAPAYGQEQSWWDSISGCR